MFDKIIPYSFYILFAITPLIWYPQTYELFEFNKMVFVYILTIIITGTWVLKMVSQKKFIFYRTPLDIPLLVFLISQILSTIFSIDPHTSLFGYYSRLNGGLLSIISYILLFYAFVSNIGKEKALQALKFGLFGGFVVALYAIPEHFGVSPSCLILRGGLDANCWVQDVQARVFATLGQPNWLAAYLGMLTFPAIYFFIQTKEKRQRIIYCSLIISYYLAFTFTYSRGATLGIIFSILLLTLLVANFKLIFNPYLKVAFNTFNLKMLAPIFIAFLLTNAIFGSALTRFQLGNLFPTNPQNTPSTDSQQATTPGLTQLENGGTESGQIRLIVWKGALDIFKNYPVFGSGVETFAYSYYQYRPTSHNLVSEWDFLYNKAHNEFLNYLATTGALGFGAYMLVIITFVYYSLSKIFKFSLHNRKDSDILLTSALLASYIFYLIQNFFGFSVVVVAMFFFLFPAFTFVLTDSTKQIEKFSIFNFRLSLNWVYKNPIFSNIAKGFVFLFTAYLLLATSRMWLADTLFAAGSRNNEIGNAGKAYNFLAQATNLNPKEPFYKNELGYSAAVSAVSLKEVDATLSAQLANNATDETEKSLKTSPNNTSFWRTAIRTYYVLSEIDESFNQKTVDAIDHTISLSPTDPKLYYNKAIILGQMDRNNEAVENLKKAVELKPNYREGYFSLAVFYFDQKDYIKAVENMNKVLQLVPNDPDALKQLNGWGQKGIATESGASK